MTRPGDPIIIPAGPGDAGALASVHVRSWRETYQGMLPSAYLDRMSEPLHARRWRQQLSRAGDKEGVFIAEGPLELLGYCAGAIDPRDDRRAEIFTLYVLRSAQGQGLGRRLMQAAARAFQAGGAAGLQLWVLADNVAAQRFYAHLGGKRADQRAVRGFGGGLSEFRYDWDDIAVLADSASQH